MKIDINDLTLGQIKELQAMCAPFTPAQPQGVAPHAFPVGKNVFIRTVTMHYTGHLVRVTEGELVLTDAAWVADSGRFHVALMSGTLDEVEPFPDGEVVVLRDGVIDCSVWAHDLPRKAQ